MSSDIVTRITPSSSEGWLTPDEMAFLENTLRDPKLFQYLYTRNVVKLNYPASGGTTYQEFASSVALDFQKSHQILRRLMHKSPYSLTNNQRAYTIMKDEKVPLRDLAIGSRIVLGYRLLLLRPKYDIGKHSSLIELVFPVTVKVIPIGTSYYVMDEDHIFILSGFERRALVEHPSHGVPYHIDLLRMVATGDVRVPTKEDQEDEESRIHIMLDETEKPNVVISSTIWDPESPPVSPHPKEDIRLEDFEKFRKLLGTVASRFSEETLTALYRVSTRKKNIVTKLLFQVHTHTLKLSHVVSEFTSSAPSDTRYTDLEDRIGEAVTTISKELDNYFLDDSTLSAAASTIYLTVSSKHLARSGENIGSMIFFDNYLVGYTSTDSITDVTAMRPGHVILALLLPPRMPILLLPEHTGISKQYRAVVLPRETVFQVEEVKSMLVLDDPKTYRKVFMLRYRRTETPATREARASRPALGTKLSTSHLLQIEPHMMSTIARDVPHGS